ncbi:MAG: hypothetical protein LBN05_00365 [Oscillospiraceae bacterium]|nr:hypothetical protein [Oscillospiraceae bacterium]
MEEMKDQTRGLAMGLRTPPTHILTEEEISVVLREAEAIGIPVDVLRFNAGGRTSYNDKLRKINVRGDVLPDLRSNSKIARDYMSIRSVLAHEYYGHYMNADNEIWYTVDDWRDEFRASYDAAVNAPNLSDVERATLMRDAYDRAAAVAEAVEFTDDARRILYGDSFT